ncbi:hypothetical protein IC608_11530 [Devosia sp. PTR5]|uniref:Uncharacterized protein n=1 Tax=Devosia oryzisoli TaxID=2774138 RepID=A0A927FWG7_9HYPH|nr:hypothetical protein [Devosia oryzisoli]MBD8066103.1 hypothetical protein [Devosia oryzisoli]
MKKKLDEAGVLPADVLGAQLSQGGVLDLFVIPDWLSKQSPATAAAAAWRPLLLVTGADSSCA